jgi:hypothetical protein
MHALAEPPVSPPLSAPTPDRPPGHDQRRVVIRLRDGESIQVGAAPNLDAAMALARQTIASLDVPEGEWPFLRDRFIRPDAIVSVDVLRWS